MSGKGDIKEKQSGAGQKAGELVCQSRSMIFGCDIGTHIFDVNAPWHGFVPCLIAFKKGSGSDEERKTLLKGLDKWLSLGVGLIVHVLEDDMWGWANIRIEFGTDGIMSSATGRYAIETETKLATMHVGGDVRKESEAAMLHLWGHALGLRHSFVWPDSIDRKADSVPLMHHKFREIGAVAPNKEETALIKAMYPPLQGKLVEQTTYDGDQSVYEPQEDPKHSEAPPAGAVLPWRGVKYIFVTADAKVLRCCAIKVDGKRCDQPVKLGNKKLCDAHTSKNA
jgi:hypothetical protein